MTPVERLEAAQQALQAAIVEHRDAYVGVYNTRVGVLMEWILVTSEMAPTDEGSDTLYGIIMTDGGIPWHRAMGLLMYAKRNLEEGPVND